MAEYEIGWRVSQGKCALAICGAIPDSMCSGAFAPLGPFDWAQGRLTRGACPHTIFGGWTASPVPTRWKTFYWREVEAPAARSLSTPRKPAAACSSESASRSMVAARCGDSGRKRTLSRLCPREVIRVLMTGGSSCFHWVQVVSTTGPGRTMVQLRDFRITLLSL